MVVALRSRTLKLMIAVRRRAGKLKKQVSQTKVFGWSNDLKTEKIKRLSFEGYT